MTLNTGLIINGRYRIAKLLGEGGFGAVYQAWDTNLSKLCALKMNLDTSPVAQRQFQKEAAVLSNLSHPNLPRVTDHFFVQGQGQFLVMDFVEGEDLENLTARQGAVKPDRAIKWIGQVADALNYLHSQPQPIIHRDIKPANIRVTPNSRAVLVDFGLVKVYDEHLKTTVGARAVTPGYSPPEQYGQGGTNPQTDIYALAATLYTLLTGQQPIESIQRIVEDTFKPTAQPNSGVSDGVGQAIGQAMSLAPSQRYDSVLDFTAALQKANVPVVADVANQQQAATVNVSAMKPLNKIPTRPSPRPYKPPSKERPGCITAYAVLLWLAGGMYLLGAGAVGIIFLSEGVETAVVGLFSSLCLGFVAALPIISGIGLWRMRKWGWWMIVVLQGISLVVTAFNMCAVFATPSVEEAIIALAGVLIGAAINGGILYWFIKNRDLFDNNAPYAQSGSGKTGTTDMVPIIIGIVAMCVIIPIVVIAILTLLGPQIGNVFSDIVTGLE